MKKLMTPLMLSCKTATELIEKQSTDKLTFTENLQLKLHNLFCKTCHAYEKQSKAIDKTISKWVKTKTKETDVHLNEAAKSEILKKIKNN